MGKSSDLMYPGKPDKDKSKCQKFTFTFKFEKTSGRADNLSDK